MSNPDTLPIQFSSEVMNVSRALATDQSYSLSPDIENIIKPVIQSIANMVSLDGVSVSIGASPEHPDAQISFFYPSTNRLAAILHGQKVNISTIEGAGTGRLNYTDLFGLWAIFGVSRSELNRASGISTSGLPDILHAYMRVHEIGMTASGLLPYFLNAVSGRMF